MELFVLKRTTVDDLSDGWAEGNGLLGVGLPHVCVGTFLSLARGPASDKSDKGFAVRRTPPLLSTWLEYTKRWPLRLIRLDELRHDYYLLRTD